MAKRTIESRKQEESDSSSSDGGKRIKKRVKRTRKSYPETINHNSVAFNKSQIKYKTSTPKNHIRNSQIAFSDAEDTSEHGNSEIDDDHCSLESVIQSSNDRIEERSNEENDHCNGFVSFMKQFDFFSDEEESVLNEQIKPNSENTGIDVSDDSSDSLEPLTDVSVLSCDMLTANNVDKMMKYFRKLACMSKNVEVLFLKHPISVPVIGNLKVTLLAGKASILGYNLMQMKPVNIFSQKQSGILTVDTIPYDRLNKQALKIIRRYLKNLLGTEYISEIKSYCSEARGVFSTVILLEEQSLPPALEFVEYYIPEAFIGIKFNIFHASYTPVLQSSTHVIELCEEHEELFTKIEHHVHRISKKKSLKLSEAITSESEITSSEDESSDHNDEKKISEEQITENQTMNGLETSESCKDANPCIFIYGPKRSGKSTMLRYLLNRFLNIYSEVFYLDTDSGQSEFTPPGAVSLIKVTEPVFGPPFTHLRHPVKMVFIGSITSETSPTMYVKSVTYLIDYFLKTFPGKILLINTMGWITGLGDMMLQYIENAANPAVKIELQAERLPLKFMAPKNQFLHCKVGFHRDPSTAVQKGVFYPSLLRDAALLAYFGRCQKSYLPLTPMNAFRPHQICWEEIFFYHFDKRLDNHRFYEGMNCSVVGLCKVKESLQLLSSSEDYPNTLDDEPLNDCLGFGLVRSIDETNHLLYIITPLSLDSLRHVNAIIGGNILIPEAVILKQPIYNKELYYTDESIGGPTNARKAIRRRARMNTTLLN